MTDLAGIQAKFQRAQYHADEFDRAAQDIVNRRPFIFDVNVEDDDWCHIRWKQNGELPDLKPLALIFSDMLYNLRASLDYIAWQLVLLNGETPGRHTAFPCVLDDKKWPDAAAKQLRGIDAVWIAKIATLQPFDLSHTGDRESHPLAILDKANNITKHRLLPASLMSAGYAAHNITGFNPGTKIDSFFNDVPIADGVDHFRFTFDRPTNGIVTVDPNPRFRIKFADVPSYDWRNRDLIDWVGEAINVFISAFI